MKKLTKALSCSAIIMSTVAYAQASQAVMFVDVSGVSGSGTTSWTFSGSTTSATNGFQQGIFFGIDDQFLEPSVATQTYLPTSGSASYTFDGTETRSISGLFLDSSNDTLWVRSAPASQELFPGDEMAWSGSLEIPIDFNLMIEGTYQNNATCATWCSGPGVLELNIGSASTSVPFEFSPTLGILAIGSVFGISRLLKRRVVPAN